MQFEKLTQDNLRILQSQGYNNLTSNNQFTDDKVIWFPEFVKDVWEYLLRVSGDEPTMLVINDALQNIEDEDLFGEVFMEKE